MFERRPFKSLQTNGTVPRSVVTKPTALSRSPELPVCLPACLCLHLPASSGVIKLKRKGEKKKTQEGETRGVTHGKKRDFAPPPHFARWLVHEEQPRWDADINKRLRWRETQRETQRCPTRTLPSSAVTPSVKQSQLGSLKAGVLHELPPCRHRLID